MLLFLLSKLLNMLCQGVTEAQMIWPKLLKNFWALWPMALDIEAQ